MKAIWKIAKAELKYLFYSPVAWLILVIFAVQAGLAYTNVFDGFIRNKLLGYPLSNLTYYNFASNWRGMFVLVQNYLYLYIPLLTMGVMSRELNSGSINLLYSSPIKNSQIILGKYMALVVFCFSIIGVLCVYSIFSIATIENADIPLILTGLLGIFLLICTYSAIGLFMSSLTSYQIVAAIGTIAILAVMNYMRQVGQEIEFVRDITYWLALPGRSNNFISGLICSEDVIYFLAIICLFLSFAVLRLKGRREKGTWYATAGKFIGVFLIVAFVGYFSARPQYMFYHDSTRTKQNTLTRNSQDVIAKLEGGLTITTYNNLLEENYWYGLPRSVKGDIDRFKQYTRFKPDIKLKYVNYYHRADNPHLDKRYPDLSDEQRVDTLRKLNNWKFKITTPEEVAKTVNLAPEKYRFVRLLEKDTGERTFLRIFNDIYKFPFETEITAAMKRLVMDDLPIVGFVTGHGERGCYDASDRGYQFFAQEITFRYSLINQGFDFRNISLEEEVPASIKMLVIAEPRKAFSPLEMENLDLYIERGDNLMILGEPDRREFVNPITEKFGVTMIPGVVVKPGRIIEPETKVVHSSGTNKIDTIPAVTIDPELMVVAPLDTAWSYHLKAMAQREFVLASPTFSALQYDTIGEYKAVPLFRVDSCWSEVETTNFVDDTVKLNPEAGEQLDSLVLVAAFSRDVNGKEQRVMITGDADWLSNKELGTSRNRINASNYSLINAAFFWLSHEEVPIDIRRPRTTDRDIRLGKTGWEISKPIINWVYPAILLVVGLLIWVRRRGR